MPGRLVIEVGITYDKTVFLVVQNPVSARGQLKPRNDATCRYLVPGVGVLEHELQSLT